MKAIFKREVKSYFTGMIGWVVAAVSLFFLGPSGFLPARYALAQP